MELPFIKEIASQGIIGILLAMSLGVNWYFIKLIQTLNDKRVADAKELTGSILTPLNSVKTNSELLITLFQKFLNETKQ